MAERLHFNTVVDEMDAFKLTDLLRYSLAIFVTSTTGQGDMPKNTTTFWKNLRRTKLNNTNCLAPVKFTIFGLGDSSYPKFNWAARKLRVRLLQLAASEFFRPGEADERHENGLDSIYLPWYQELKESLLSQFPLPEGMEPMPDDAQLPPKYNIRLGSVKDKITNGEGHLSPAEHGEKLAAKFERMSTDSQENEAPGQKDGTGVPDFPPAKLLPIPGSFTAEVVCNKRVTPEDHWQDVRHIELKVRTLGRNGAISFAGQTLLIYSKNYPEDVQKLIDLMGWGEVAEQRIEIDWAKDTRPRDYHFPQGATVRDVLTHNFDITAVPKRTFLEFMAYHTTNPLEKERLQELTQRGDSDEFYDYTSRPRRTILEVLEDFPGVKIPYTRLLEFPIIRPREFSLCNGGDPTVKEDQVISKSNEQGRDNVYKFEILAALVHYRTIIRKPRQGLCSRYLRHLPVGTTIQIGIKPPSSPFAMDDPSFYTRPLIGVATGTGIAPFRALLQDRCCLVQNKEKMGSTLLFFGCRNASADYHFQAEWRPVPNLVVHPAFSRDTSDFSSSSTEEEETKLLALQRAAGIYDAGKNYVQHQIRQHAAEVGKLLRENPIIVVCGNSGRMPKSVREALEDAAVVSGIVSDKEEAKGWFDRRENCVYWQETW
ncbi:NAPDH-dependent diflavin reductase [Neurospora sp. IMI 360204]|nr:NAPDH-dependent diflavin reductase [Neurospora sp. IMI 360204]